jgi:hypothetical protein
MQPVMRALINARLQDEPTAFGRWCIVHNIRSLPAAPIHVATFVTECGAAMMPLDTIWQAVREVSSAHLANGWADPTAAGPVVTAMNDVSKLDPPRSWPKELWPRFFDLPLDLQQYLLERDNEQNRVIRRALNEAAEARKALAAIQQPAKEAKDDGTNKDTAPADDRDSDQDPAG